MSNIYICTEYDLQKAIQSITGFDVERGHKVKPGITYKRGPYKKSAQQRAKEEERRNQKAQQKGRRPQEMTERLKQAVQQLEERRRQKREQNEPNAIEGNLYIY